MGEVDSDVLTGLFQHQVLEAIVAQRRLSRDFAQKLRAWHPSGFGVHRGRPIDPLECPQCGHALEIIAVLEPSRLRPPEPPVTRFSGTRSRIGPTEGLELFSQYRVSLCLSSASRSPFLLSSCFHSQRRHGISTPGSSFLPHPTSFQPPLA